METITKIAPQVKNKSRFNIFLDGEYVCALNSFTIAKNRLKVGDEIDTLKLTEIQRQDEGAAAFEKAVDYIALKSRTEKEIRKYLADKDIIGVIADEIIAKLYEYHFLDDSVFASNFVANRRKVWGVKRLKMELRRRGVDDLIIEEVLEEMPPQNDEALNLAEKYVRQHSKLDYNKLYAHLASKGFDYDSIKSAISKIKERQSNFKDDLDNDIGDEFDTDGYEF